MAKNILADLVLRLSANSAELTKGLKEANSSLSGLQKNTKNVGGQIVGAFAKVAGVIYGLKGAFNFVKGAMQAIEGPGDALAETIGGVKGAFFELQRAVATLDFSHFFKNLIEGYKKGKDLEKMLDELADRTAYTDYKVSQLEGDKARLKEVVKNKGLELKVRQDAADQILKIEEDIKKRRDALALETYTVDKKGWEDKAKMSVESALKLDEKIKSLDEKQAKALNDTWKYVTDQLGLRGDAALKKMQEIGKATGVNSFKALGIPQDVIDSYIEYQKLQSAQSDVLPKLYKVAGTYQAALTGNQMDYNRELGITSGLLEKEEKVTKNAGDATMTFASAMEAATKAMKEDAIQGAVQLAILEKLRKEREGATPAKVGLMQPAGPFNPKKLFEAPTIQTKLAPPPKADVEKTAAAFGITANAYARLKAVLETSPKWSELGIGQINDELAKRAAQLGDTLVGMNEILGMGLTDMAVTFAEGIGRLVAGEKGFTFGQTILSSIANFIGQLGAYMIMMSPAIAAAKAAIKSMNPALMLVGGVALVALAGIIKGSIAKMGETATAMAEGGIVTKPTLALLGEAGKNEAVIPLPKGGLGLEGLMGGANNKHLDVYGKIANRDLALTNRRSSKYN